MVQIKMEGVGKVGSGDRIQEKGEREMKEPPFIVRCNTPMEKYRYETWDTKEPETIAWIDSFKPGSVFWDVGANIGIYSLYCGSLDRDIRVLAFEPQDANNDALHLNRDESRFTMRPDGFMKIEVLKFALGDMVCTKRLEIPDPTSGATGAQVNDVKGWAVQVTTIDHLVHVFPGYPAPDYLKIDIDGQEYEVLLGALDTLSSKSSSDRVKSVLVEVSRGTKGKVLRLMEMAGFRLDDRFNKMTPHSSDRRLREGIDAENIVFVS
jgi:FkbM family methyltransferase